MGFYITINRDKQRQNTVLSFSDDEKFREIERLANRINMLSSKYDAWLIKRFYTDFTRIAI
ncbi:MAG TPA: hypothetical protein DDY31_16330 [Lachnospiraceae bacterium]|nr:hypothetical protein [Lachnospiraceae bacterium]